MRNFLKNFLIFLVVFSWVFLSWPQVLADTTSVLRPTADGGNDSTTWENKAGSSCDTADCYLEVYESSGSSCTNSDGNTTYINSSNGGQAQTFDIDESGIPDNSTITQIDITVCHTKEGGGGGTFQTRVCHNGSCTNSGSTITVGASYSETTQQISVNYTKSTSSDIEIGVIDINTAKKVRISQISAVITYTPPDTTPPDAVADLTLSNPFNNAMTVSWTAPGDDGSIGTATTYDLRYSTSEITDVNWSSATQVFGEPMPSVVGSAESMTVSGLAENTTYYFALKTSDEVPNESGLSNVPSLATTTIPDTTPPDAVTNLALSDPYNTAMTVSWIAPGDDGSIGTATTYDLRYSTSTITDVNWSSATQVFGEPMPSAAGSSESMAVYGLSENTTYYFALKTSDKVPNESGLSNVPSLATTTIPPPPPPPPPPPSVGGGGDEEPRRVYFSGQAYPGSKIELLKKREEIRAFVSEPVKEYTMLEDGTFEIMLEGLIGVKFFFALRAEDEDGRKSGILSFSADMGSKNELVVENIFFPPTVGFENTVVTKNQEIEIMGYAASNNKIEIKVNDIIKGETQSDETGYWTFSISAIELDFGEHYVRVRQINQFGRESGFSFPRAFKVSPLELPKADFNNDSKVDLTDWSIFLFRWGSEDESLKSKIDMNNDGNIDIADFSIFLKTMKI